MADLFSTHTIQHSMSVNCQVGLKVCAYATHPRSITPEVLNRPTSLLTSTTSSKKRWKKKKKVGRQRATNPLNEKNIRQEHLMISTRNFRVVQKNCSTRPQVVPTSCRNHLCHRQQGQVATTLMSKINRQRGAFRDLNSAGYESCASDKSIFRRLTELICPHV